MRLISGILRIGFLITALAFSTASNSTENCSESDLKLENIWSSLDFVTHNKYYTNDWNKVVRWAELMNAQSLCGYEDWKVASIAEYRTLRNSDIDKNILNNTSDYYWARNEINKWIASYFSFNDGFATSGDKTGQKWANGPNKNKDIKFNALLVRKANK